MSLPTIVYDLDTDASGNGTLLTDPLVGWLSEIQVNYQTGGDGTLIITADFNGITETILNAVTGGTDNTFPITRPLVDQDGAETGTVGYWNLTGQELTCISTANGALLTPAIELKFGGSR